MKNKLHIITITALAAAVAFPLQAAEKKPKAEAKAAASAAPEAAADKVKLPFKGKIASVDKDKKTITLEAKTGAGRTLAVSESAKVMKSDESAATWDDLKVGEEVRGSYSKGADGTLTVVKIKVGAKMEGAKKEKEPKAAKTEKAPAAEKK